MVVWGLVKRFDTTRGYGFLAAGDGKGDILLHVRQLRAFGVSSVAEGARVRVRAEDSARGRWAAEVLEIEPPGTKPGTKELPPDAGPLEPAYVRWFDRAMGYGFVRVFGRPEDVYLHMATLREYGFGAVMAGDALAVRVTDGPRGPTVCEVRDWDYPNRPRGRRRESRRPIAYAASRSAWGLPGGRDPWADAAILKLLREDALGGTRGWPRAAPGAGAALSGSDIEALVALRHHTRHVETILARVIGPA